MSYRHQTYEEANEIKKRWILKSKELYGYLLTNFHDLIPNDTTISHFDVWIYHPCLESYMDDIKEKYEKDIQIQLIKWIKSEIESDSFFQEENWTYFRDPITEITILFGYRKLFLYNNYYFLISLLEDCENGNSIVRLVTALYGWKVKDEPYLYPFKSITIPSDNKVPDKHWFSHSK